MVVLLVGADAERLAAATSRDRPPWWGSTRIRLPPPNFTVKGGSWSALITGITGITGQDGSYLAELLLGKGYEVHGLIRRASTFNTNRIDHLYQDPHAEGARLFLHYGDLSDGARLVTLMHQIQPDEVYNLAAQSHVRVSFDEPEHTGDTTGIGAMRLLEAVRLAGVDCRYYSTYPSTSSPTTCGSRPT